MNTHRFPLDLFSDPQVKAYFFDLLDSPLPDEVKYQQFSAFLQRRWHMVEAEAVPEIPTSTAPAYPSPPVGVADGETAAVVRQTLESLLHALGRMQRSQHQDGGWGAQVEQSDFWRTAYGVLFLHAVQDLPGIDCTASLDETLCRGVEYLEQHPESWSTDSLSTQASLSVYEVSLMVRCFYRLGRSFIRRESAQRIYRSIDRLYHSQNEDGGWDANLWGYEIMTPTRIWSEAGATAAALLALAETRDDRFRPTIEKGLHWLAGTQNMDGSWNDGSCHPRLPAYQLSGQASIPKTSDALQGMLIGATLHIPLQPYQGCIERAVDWLSSQVETVLYRVKQPGGWGFGYSAADYEHACLIFETLLQEPSAPLPLLVSNANWLVQSQRRQDDDPEDGSWVLGHTARIGLALTNFYRRASRGLATQSLTWVP